MVLDGHRGDKCAFPNTEAKYMLKSHAYNNGE